MSLQNSIDQLDVLCPLLLSIYISSGAAFSCLNTDSVPNLQISKTTGCTHMLPRSPLLLSLGLGLNILNLVWTVQILWSKVKCPFFSAPEHIYKLRELPSSLLLKYLDPICYVLKYTKEWIYMVHVCLSAFGSSKCRRDGRCSFPSAPKDISKCTVYT